MVKAIVKAMVTQDKVLPKVVFCSPLERTKNTADLVGLLLGIQVNVIDDLSPNRPLEDRIVEIMGHGAVKRVMLVGHVDNTTPAFNNLAGDKNAWDDLVMAEVRRLRINRKTGEWKLRWSVKPSDLGLRDRTG